ncbi:RNA polymerase sigma factor [Sulfitobacter sp.]|uniref:RNA polymerase sigma factor n=1 Tax=Sulfitobacter sp. TaxID=1903071 RepID=UPI003EF1892E
MQQELNDNPLIAVDFEGLVRANIGWMLGLAGRILNDHDLAKDAVQLAFSKIHLKIDQFEGRSHPKTWMHRIVVNEALMILRKKKRANEQSIDQLLPSFDARGMRVPVPHVTAETSETALHSKQTVSIVRELISELPDAYRVVLQLRDIEEMTTAEVSDFLEITETNVKVRLHRARTALKSLLEPMFYDGQI